MVCLVTGGGGSLGKAVCSVLQSRGHKVAVFDVLSPQPIADAYIQGDIRDGWKLLAFAREQRVDSIVHLASLLNVESSNDPARAVEVNCRGFINVCETARHVGSRRLVWASSVGVYGNHDEELELDDDTPFSPTTIYAATKVLNELIADHYFERFGIETVSLRFTAIVAAGKGSGKTGLISRELIDKPVRGEHGQLPWGKGGQNWLWAGDAAEVVFRALTVPQLSTRHFNVGGDNRSLQDAVSIVEALVPGARVTLGSEYRSSHRINSQVLEQELGFSPRWKLEDQLAELVKQAREERARDGP